MGPYEIVEIFVKVAYEFKVASEFASVHPIFHVSMVKKCMGDPDLIFPIKGHGVKDNLSYEEIRVQCLYMQVKK